MLARVMQRWSEVGYDSIMTLNPGLRGDPEVFWVDNDAMTARPHVGPKNLAIWDGMMISIATSCVLILRSSYRTPPGHGVVPGDCPAHIGREGITVCQIIGGAFRNNPSRAIRDTYFQQLNLKMAYPWVRYGNKSGFSRICCNDEYILKFFTS